MAQTLTYGYILPQTGDRGSVFFPALEDNIQQVNDHDHDGSNSALLSTASSVVLTTDVPSGSWATPSNGIYSQVVTLPASLSFDNINISFRVYATGEKAYLKYVKLTASTFRVYCNDSSIRFTAVYTS